MEEGFDLRGSFGAQLQELIDKAVSAKLQQLDAKEANLEEREKKLQHIMGNMHAKGRVNIQVGTRLFSTTADILLSEANKDSYFSGLLNKEFAEPQDGVYFIARDPNIFEYVLEYLIYGRLVSRINDTNVLEKLVIDADFYLLPMLKASAMKQLEEDHPQQQSKAKTFAKFDGVAIAGSGHYWQWSAKITHRDITLSTHSYNNDTVTVSKAGKYLVLIRTTFTNSLNGVYMSLYINGADVARCYNCFNSNYQASTQINEVFELPAGAKLQVYQTYNNGAQAGPRDNQFSILLLE
eukprot:TRINITY_DN7898_c0_g1_i1.p1 TRINITY_DN7898_c0_g1~~TRINITY_DN7898_c0_g1_i1.p1  ORF type:complete len:294 (+),score=67.94 TRINITY_DN7898_c0_g1_i1:1-882(+)